MKHAYSPSGVAAAAGGVFLWGCGAVIIRLTTSPILMVVLYRLFMGIPMLAIAWWFGRDRSLPWKTASIGGVLFAAHQMANFTALRYSTVAVVTIFFSLQPIVVGAVSKRVTGEGTTPRFYLWALVAIVGCATLVLAANGQHHGTPLGNILAVANLFLWCAYYLATKRARATVSTLPWLFVMSITAAATVAVFSLFAKQSFAPPQGKNLVLILALAAGPGTLGHFLVTWAQPRIHAAASSAIIVGVPIVAAIGAALFAHEPFTVAEVIGAGIALGATVLAMRHLPPPVTAEAAETYGEITSS